MPHRARAAKASAISLISQSKTIPSPKPTRSKNSSPTKRSSVSSRKKRLASLTTATLLQYCTNILSPSSNKNQQKTAKRKLRSTNTSPMSRNNQKKKKVKNKVYFLTKKFICLILDETITNKSSTIASLYQVKNPHSTKTSNLKYIIKI
jgi:hypothetical protein